MGRYIYIQSAVLYSDQCEDLLKLYNLTSAFDDARKLMLRFKFPSTSTGIRQLHISCAVTSFFHSPDICSFGLLVGFLLSNPSFQVYHPFSPKGPHNPVGEHLLLGTRILMYFYQNTFILKTPYNFFLR